MPNKRYMVIPRTPKALKEGITVGGKHRSYKGKTAMYVKDQAEAEEIVQTVGMKGTGEVLVHEDDRVERFVRDEGVKGRGIHHYHWGYNSAFAQGWERIFGKAHERGDRTAPEVTKDGIQSQYNNSSAE